MNAYVLGSDAAEIARLQKQAAMLAEATDLLLARGGLEPGMRVLDLGSGPGDLTFQAAGLVGDGGSVLGIELDTAQIDVANRRLRTLGLPNVEFRQADVRSFTADRQFDAIVCRLLFPHLPGAVDVLSHQMDNLVTGGLFISVDFDTGGFRALPEVGLLTRVQQWAETACAHAQTDPRVGMRLPLYLRQAGFSDVGSCGLQNYSLPQDGEAIAYLVETVRSLRGAIVASGIATEAEMDLDTLAARLTESIRASNAVWSVATVVGNWGRRP